MNLAVFCRSILFSALNDLYFTRQYFVVFYAVFFFLISSNLIGLLPFAFTVTSQIILTFGLSFFLFFAANWLAVQRHGLNYFSLFLPSGSPFFMSFLLVPIEIISYVARVFSLSIRLFANMMAGHCLLKIIAGFAWTMLLMGGLISFFFVVPYVVVVLVTVLELIVAFLQAYVYCLLLSIYIRDCVYLH
jgi:ATP synthase subunit 6